MSVPVLALIYWLHLIATVLWLGGLAALTLVVWPGLSRALIDDQAHVRRALDALERRFRPLANSWSLAMLLKHIVIAAMIAVSAVMQAVVRPALDREALLAQRGKADDPLRESALRRRLRRLTALNLGLGMLVLLFTALMAAL